MKVSCQKENEGKKTKKRKMDEGKKGRKQNDWRNAGEED
jgi:hypothetical protein